MTAAAVAKTEIQTPEADADTGLVGTVDRQPDGQIEPALPGTPCSDGFSLDQCTAEAAWVAVEVAQDAATWTEAGFWAGLSGMLIAGLAAWFAYRAFDAARQANTIATQSAKRQDRAYVDFKDVSWKQAKVSGDRANYVLRLELRNYGHTPADDLSLELGYGLCDPTTFEVIEGAQGAETLPDLGAIMPQDDWGRNTNLPLTIAQHDGLSTGAYAVRFDVAASYKDTFGEEHKLKAIFVSGKGTETMAFLPGTRTNS